MENLRLLEAPTRIWEGRAWKRAVLNTPETCRKSTESSMVHPSIYQKNTSISSIPLSRKDILWCLPCVYLFHSSNRDASIDRRQPSVAPRTPRAPNGFGPPDRTGSTKASERRRYDARDRERSRGNTRRYDAGETTSETNKNSISTGCIPADLRSLQVYRAHMV